MAMAVILSAKAGIQKISGILHHYNLTQGEANLTMALSLIAKAGSQNVFGILFHCILTTGEPLEQLWR